MQQLYHLITVIGFSISGLLLSVVLFLIRSKKDKVAVNVKKVLIAGFSAVIFNILTIIGNQSTLLIWFALFSSSISWVCLFLYEFVQDYTSIFRKIMGVRFAIYFYCIFETVAFLVNAFHPAFFNIEPIEFRGEIFYKIISTGYSLYAIHIVFTYILIGLVFIEMLIASMRAPKLYKNKFLDILLSFMIPVIIDTIYVFTDFPIDPSVFAFALSGFMLSYFAMFYSPSEVRKNMIMSVLDDSQYGVICFNADNHVILMNDSIKKYLHLPENYDDYDEIEKYFEQWKAKHPDWETHESIEWTQEETYNGKFTSYEVVCSKLFDEKKLYLGTYILIQDNTDLLKKLEEQKYLANHDRLTGLYNREYFYKKVSEQFKNDPDRDYCIITSDIKDFKLVNDVFGTHAGDKVLKQIGDSLLMLAKEGSVYGRFHGDRFVLCMPTERFDEDHFYELANKAVSVDGSDIYHIQLNLGVYRVTNKDIPVSVMCDRAFLALSSIKNDYKRNVAYYSDDLREHALSEQAVAQRLEEAMAKNQFDIYLQPQMDLNGKVLGAEALVRWNDPVKGIIPPADFIGIFEKTGAIAEMDTCVWTLACMQLRKWADRGIDLHLSVNISPKDFYFTDVYKTFTQLVERYEIDPKKLKLEITETAIMIDLEKQCKLVKDLQNYGFCVEMDDFGSGYSSLNMLKDINVDVLKIDMAFLGKTGDINRARTILKMIMNMSKELNMPVITEGVETKDQFEYLKGIGCDMFQGNYFSCPIPVSEFEEKFLKNQ